MSGISKAPLDVEEFRKLETIGSLAGFLGTTEKRLFFHLYSDSRPKYRHFHIQKKSGGVRSIAAPPSVVRSFQLRLLPYLVATAPAKPAAHGFVRNRSVFSNAKGHVGSRYVFNVDLQDFFPTIHFGRVRGLFRKNPFNFNDSVATVIAQLCCDMRALPQGAPTSPHISNLICRGLDKDLDRLARSHLWTYSRYCDDLTFSGDGDSLPRGLVTADERGHNGVPGDSLVRVVTAHGFALNTAKTRLQKADGRQEVTGLVVNEKVNVPRQYVRSIRAIVHDIESRGYEAADGRFRRHLDKKTRRGDSPALKDSLLGRLAYLRMIRGADDPMYLRLGVRASHVLPRRTGTGVQITGRGSLEVDLLKECVGVLIGRDIHGADVSTGTAVAIAAVGFVTAAHLLEEAKAVKWELRLARNQSRVFRVRGCKFSSNRDLAILRCEEPIAACLAVRREPAEVGERTRIAGFPNWVGETDSLMVAKGEVTQTREINGNHYLLLDLKIRGGNSGGPILSEGGAVIGIVRYDYENLGLPNSGISVRHLSEVAELPWIDRW